MSGNHDSEHKHVEPSRVLPGEPFPETIVVYDHPDSTSAPGTVSPETLEPLIANYGVQVIVSIAEATDRNSLPDPAQLETVSSDRVNFFNQPFDSPPESLAEANSLLFVPRTLECSEGLWEELSDNDTTVNWIGLESDTRSHPDRLKARVLSDWVVQLDRDLPVATAVGVETGVIHLRGELLKNFFQSAPHEDWSVLNQWLTEDSIKLRPNLIHNQEWSS